MPIDNIQREDWGPGGEHRGTAPVTVHGSPQREAPSPQEVTAMIERGEAPTPEIQRALGVEPADASLPVTSASTEHGLPTAIVQEMYQSIDGFDAQVELMRASAQRVLADLPAEYRDTFVSHFDGLPEGIKTKAYRALRAEPHLDIYTLIDRVQAKLTLNEMAHARAWLQGLKR